MIKVSDFHPQPLILRCRQFYKATIDFPVIFIEFPSVSLCTAVGQLDEDFGGFCMFFQHIC